MAIRSISTSGNLLSIPEDVIFIVLSFLDKKDLVELSGASKKTNNLAISFLQEQSLQLSNFVQGLKKDNQVFKHIEIENSLENKNIQSILKNIQTNVEIANFYLSSTQDGRQRDLTS